MTDVLEGLDEPAEQATEPAPAPTTETAAPAEPAPEPVKVEAQAEAPKAEGPKSEDRYVPLETMLAERKKLQAKLAEEESARKALLERLERLEKATAPEKAPDFMDDPKGYVDSAVAKIEAAAKNAEKESAEVRAARERDEQMQKFVGAIQTDEAQFVAKTPDYQQALSYLREQRAAELQLLYPEAEQAQILAQVAQEELALANRAFQAGRSPADLAYQYAQRRGYKRADEKPKATVTPIKPEAAAAAAVTLGAGGGASDQLPTEDEGDGLNEFDSALREVFGKR